MNDYQIWVKKFINSTTGETALQTLSADLDGDESDSKNPDHFLYFDYENDRPGPTIVYHDNYHTYSNFENLILSACYHAATCPDDPSEKSREIQRQTKFDFSGEGRSAIKIIEDLKAVIKRNNEAFNWVFFYSTIDLWNKQRIKIGEGLNPELYAKKKQLWRSGKLFINDQLNPELIDHFTECIKEDKLTVYGGSSEFTELLDAILSEIQEKLDYRVPHLYGQEAMAANLFFAKRIERKRSNAVRDGLIYLLAYLIKDWKSGRYKAFNLGYGTELQSGGNAYPNIISELVAATLPPHEHIDPCAVSERLKALKKQGARIEPWPHER